MATLADLFTSIANAIRAKGGTSAQMYPSQMPQAIADIQPQISLQRKTKSYTPSEISQSENVEADSNYDGLERVSVSVGAIPSDYVGSDVTKRSSTDLTASGAKITAPAGYYAAAAEKSVAAGTEGTPTATKGTVSNHAVTVTPKVTNAAGYIAGGTKSGTGVSVTAAELVSGSETITENGTYDVTNLQQIVANVSGGGEDTLLQALRNAVTSVEDDTLTSIRSYGLAYMTALTSVNFPNLQTINSYAFYDDYNIIWNGWPFPKAKTIGNYAFRYCYGLTGDLVLPTTVTSIGQYAFASCKNITKFTAEGNITTFGTYTFAGASADHKMTVKEIHLPHLGTGIALNLNFGSATAANACQNLEVCDIGNAKSIAANTFANCYKLQTLIMRRTGSVTTCANVSAFLNTPVRGRSGLTAKIYVPQALIDTYKAASVWSTINGYGYVEWLPIEGSEWEL